MVITTPPENTTVCRGSDVTINCGHLTATALPVTWIINGISFTQQEILNSPLYQQNSNTLPTANSLTVFSINGTTTFQCIVLSTPTTTSTSGTVIVFGKYIWIQQYNDVMYVICSMYVQVCYTNILFLRLVNRFPIFELIIGIDKFKYRKSVYHP